MPQNFLTAGWRKLAIANYAVDPAMLLPWLPFGTELDTWNGNCYVSLVGFRFVNVKLLGIPVPFHRNFDEVNLRFYVTFREGATLHRGVVFIREIVPLPALSMVANLMYHENYITLPMRHSWKQQNGRLQVSYAWKKKRWHRFSVDADAIAVPMAPGSEEEFITEHYRGYTRLTAASSSQYEVTHPRWEVYPVGSYTIDVDFGEVYGKEFSFLDRLQPVSVVLAEGSEIAVKPAGKIR